MSREKTRSHAARSTALVQTWIDQSETLLLFFAETNQRQSCSRVPQSSWSSPLYMRRRALGRDWVCTWSNSRCRWKDRRTTKYANRLAMVAGLRKTTGNKNYIKWTNLGYKAVQYPAQYLVDNGQYVSFTLITSCRWISRYQYKLLLRNLRIARGCLNLCLSLAVNTSDKL